MQRILSCTSRSFAKTASTICLSAIVFAFSGEAQGRSLTKSLESAQTPTEIALSNELIAAMADPARLSSIIERELASGNDDTLLAALSDAVVALAFQDPAIAATFINLSAATMAKTNATAAALLVTETAVLIAAKDISSAAGLIEVALTLSSDIGAGVLAKIGTAASIVATTAKAQGNLAALTTVVTAVSNSDTKTAIDAFVATGGSNGSVTATIDGTIDLDAIAPAAGPALVQTPPPPPPISQVPIVIEPNPSQSGSPT